MQLGELLLANIRETSQNDPDREVNRAGWYADYFCLDTLSASLQRNVLAAMNPIAELSHRHIDRGSGVFSAMCFSILHDLLKIVNQHKCHVRRAPLHPTASHTIDMDGSCQLIRLAIWCDDSI